MTLKNIFSYSFSLKSDINKNELGKKLDDLLHLLLEPNVQDPVRLVDDQTLQVFIQEILEKERRSIIWNTCKKKVIDSVAADPHLLLTDPDSYPDHDPDIFVSDLQDGN